MVTLLFFATELTVKFHSHIQLVSAIHSFIANESNMGLFHIYQTDTSFFPQLLVTQDAYSLVSATHALVGQQRVKKYSMTRPPQEGGGVLYARRQGNSLQPKLYQVVQS